MPKSTERESITRSEHIYAINEWWRRYRDEPERFQREFQAVLELNLAEQENRVPSLGENDWAYMNQILDERDAAKAKRVKALVRVERAKHPSAPKGRIPKVGGRAKVKR